MVNGFPLWRLEGGERWIFSGVDTKAWMVGGPEEVAANFACDTGFVTNGEEHNGLMPDKLALWYVDPNDGDSTDVWSPDPLICFLRRPWIVRQPDRFDIAVNQLHSTEKPVDRICTGGTEAA